ncbi:MAG: endonuclease/exonuclease/phosphatase family protein [Verrucomicrobia bacterium]|nr:endonuclease/exonuclease/phosphatase family protein [Verrucomicrobiota bacterium]
MLTRWGSRWRTLREWTSVEEWAVRGLRLRRPPETGFQPGLLILELSGCPRPAWRQARQRGEMPFLESLCSRQNYREHPYYAGCPLVRAAREAELFYGESDLVPGERFLDPDGRERDLARPEDGQRFNEILNLRKEGLLTGGSAWHALIPGGAAPDDHHPSAPPARAPLATRIRREFGAVLDLRRGLPVVYHRFCAPAATGNPIEDREQWTRYDRGLEALYQSARYSRRRDYEIWILLTPEVPLAPLPAHFAARLQTALGFAWRVTSSASETMPAGVRPVLRIVEKAGICHLYAGRSRLSNAEKKRLASLIVVSGLAASVLWRDDNGLVCWSDQTLKLRRDDFVAGTRPVAWLQHQIDHDLTALAAHPAAGDLVLVRTPLAPPQTPEEGESLLGTALLPKRTRLGVSANGELRAAHLYTAGRHVLGRAALPPVTEASPLRPHLRLVTYNVHRCIGMDGRQSLKRIRRILAELDADFIAIQEVSAIGGNQAELIAGELGMQCFFCPTLTGTQAYGHALLSRHPLSAMHIGLLPLTSDAPWKEPRGAVWVRAFVGTRPLNIIATHLALGRSDRTAQIDALLGAEWIGRVPPHEPLVLCGDFNLTPSGRNYRRLTSRLRDAQLAQSNGPVLKTFSTLQPLARLDHVFLSAGFVVERVQVPRTHLTEVSSDHFPLVVDVSWHPPQP